MLHECEASIKAQTVSVLEHLVAVDADSEGPSVVRNRLAAQARGDWVLPVDDDDTLDPDYLQVMAPHLTDDVDVAYSWCRVQGLDDWTPNRLFNAGVLVHEGNFIPVTALIRRSLLDELGGWPEPPERLQPGEDWELWKLALGAGAVFRLVPEVLWTYRIQADTRNWQQTVA